MLVNRLVGMGHKEKAICLRLFKCFSELMSAMQPYATNLFLCLSVNVRENSAFHIFPLKFSFPREYNNFLRFIYESFHLEKNQKNPEDNLFFGSN